MVGTVNCMNKLLKVSCPHCDKVFPYYESEFRPFCCERCKMIDLGHWFEETYKVPVKESVTEKNTNQPGNDVDQKENDQNDSYTQIDEDQYDENDY